MGGVCGVCCPLRHPGIGGTHGKGRLNSINVGLGVSLLRNMRVLLDGVRFFICLFVCFLLLRACLSR